MSILNNVWIAFGGGIFIGVIIAFGSLVIMTAAHDSKIRRNYAKSIRKARLRQEEKANTIKSKRPGCFVNDVN